MAALDFPASPSLNQQYSTSNAVWKWNGSAWIRIGSISPGVQGAAGAQGAQGVQGAVGDTYWASSTAGLSTTSDVTITGALTYEDVKNVDAVGIVTARDHIKITTDNKSLYLGASDDFQLFHNGSHNIIKSNNGNLYFQDSDYIEIGDPSGKVSIGCVPSGATNLRYNGNTKLATNNTGVTVTGTVAATSYTGDGSNLTGISGGVSSDSQENVIGGTDAGAALDSDTLRNTFLGHHAGKVVNSGDDNVFVGHKAGDACTSGNKNVGVGAEVLPYLTSGYSNVCVGWEAGRSIESANKNTCIGDMAGRSMSGNDNIAIGYHAYSNGGGTRCIGMMDGSVWLGGTDVIGIGMYTMARGGSQTGGIGIGYYAGRNNVGDYNIYLGYESGKGTGSSPYSNGDNNIGLGYRSLYSVTTAGSIIAIGRESATALTTGSEHIAIGYHALKAITSNNGCVAVGYEAGLKTTGQKNTVVGSGAFKEITSGQYNVGLGYFAGDNLQTGDNNIIIGYYAAASSASVSNEITLGDSNITKFRLPGINLSIDSDGVKFNGDTAAANGLDDYEEGTFTPVLYGSSTGTSSNSINGSGAYVKVGNKVTIAMRWVNVDGTTLPSSQNIRIGSLPFGTKTSFGYQVSSNILKTNVGHYSGDLYSFAQTGTIMYGWRSISGNSSGSWQSWTTSQWDNSSLRFYLNHTYITE